MPVILAYKKETEGNTVKFVQQLVEVGATMYRHEITLNIYHAGTSSSAPLTGTYVVYSTKLELTSTEAVKACSMVRGTHFTANSSQQNPVYQYIEDTDKIRVLASYGGGYSEYAFQSAIIVNDIVTVA